MQPLIAFPPCFELQLVGLEQQNEPKKGRPIFLFNRRDTRHNLKQNGDRSIGKGSHSIEQLCEIQFGMRQFSPALTNNEVRKRILMSRPVELIS